MLRTIRLQYQLRKQTERFAQLEQYPKIRSNWANAKPIFDEAIKMKKAASGDPTGLYRRVRTPLDVYKNFSFDKGSGPAKLGW